MGKVCEHGLSPVCSELAGVVRPSPETFVRPGVRGQGPGYPFGGVAAAGYNYPKAPRAAPEPSGRRG